MTARRAMTFAVLTGLISAGTGLYTATRIWQETSFARPAPLPPEIVTRTGADVAAWTIPAAVVGLAAAIAIVATSGGPRRGVAALLTFSGTGLLLGGLYGFAEAVGPWPVATVLAGTGVLVSGAWSWRRGGGWPRMSGRYDRANQQKTTEAAVLPDDPAALWDALDRGEDPTSLSIGQTAPGEECAR